MPQEDRGESPVNPEAPAPEGRKDLLFRTRPFSALISRRSSSSTEFPLDETPLVPRIEGRPREYVCVVMYPVKFERTWSVRCLAETMGASGGPPELAGGAT